jgi:hypothetical protein
LPVSQRWITQYFAQLIRDAQQRGDASPDIDPDHEARLILFANTGLILGVLAGVHSLDEATAALEYHLDRVFHGSSPATSQLPQDERADSADVAERLAP